MADLQTYRARTGDDLVPDDRCAQHALEELHRCGQVGSEDVDMIEADSHGCAVPRAYRGHASIAARTTDSSFTREAPALACTPSPVMTVPK